MRTVARSPSLNPALRKCSTNPGKSVEPVCGDHSTASPCSPAIEVKVPHPCAVSPEKTDGFSEPISPAEIVRQLARRAQDIARKEFIFMVGLRKRQRFASHPLPFQTPIGPPLLTTGLGLDTERT